MQAATRPVATALNPPVTTVEPELRYLGATALSLRGPRSGRLYLFYTAGDVSAVAPVDVNALLATRLFELEDHRAQIP